MTVDHSGPEVMEGVGCIFAEEAKIPGQTEATAVVALQAENARLVAALEPFAAYSRQMHAYGAFHRGQQLPDAKVLAYSQTEMGTSAALVVGHFRDAEAVFPGKPRGWDGCYRTTLRAADDKARTASPEGSQ